MGRFQQNQVQQGEIQDLSLGADVLTADARKEGAAPTGVSQVAPVVKYQCRRPRFHPWVMKIPWRRA